MTIGNILTITDAQYLAFILGQRIKAQKANQIEKEYPILSRHWPGFTQEAGL
ncbi:MAG: hypothetical protein AB3N23_10820 [Paracoccaceae bacterium]